MALCKCPECGKEGVSETARSCPNCGFDICTYQRRLKYKNARRNLWARILDFFGTKLGKVLGITFVIGFLLVCLAICAVDENKHPWVLLIPAGYFVVAFLGIAYLLKSFFDDATTVAVTVCSPMGLFLVIFAIVNELGWMSYSFLEWGIYGSMLISIMIFEYKIIKELE